MSASQQSHWTILKDNILEDGCPWRFEHRINDADPHYAEEAHLNGGAETFKGALTAMIDLSWAECGLALDLVPFHGLELGIGSVPGGMRICALDVAGFRFFEEATAYAEVLRGMSATDAIARAEHDGHMVSPMDADDEDMYLPIIGATAYLYDPKIGTTWVHDLDSWERSPHLTAS